MTACSYSFSSENVCAYAIQLRENPASIGETLLVCRLYHQRLSNRVRWCSAPEVRARGGPLPLRHVPHDSGMPDHRRLGLVLDDILREDKKLRVVVLEVVVHTTCGGIVGEWTDTSSNMLAKHHDQFQIQRRKSSTRSKEEKHRPFYDSEAASPAELGIEHVREPQEHIGALANGRARP